MENHYPTMQVDKMFTSIGLNASHHFCTTCSLRISDSIHNMNETFCLCGKESDFGCHGIRNEEVYSEYYCKNCYNKREV